MHSCLPALFGLSCIWFSNKKLHVFSFFMGEGIQLLLLLFLLEQMNTGQITAVKYIRLFSFTYFPSKTGWHWFRYFPPCITFLMSQVWFQVFQFWVFNHFLVTRYSFLSSSRTHLHSPACYTHLVFPGANSHSLCYLNHATPSRISPARKKSI